MFDFVQKYKRAIQVFLFLIALTFMTWGIESYSRFQGSGDAVAKVNGIEITRREFDDEMRRQQDQLRQMFGGQFNPEVFDTPEARQALVDGLVSQRLVSSEAIRANLTVSDETLREMIAQVPAFQAGGQFSKTAYETMLRSQSPPLTPAQYENRLRHDLAVQQLAFAVGAAIPSRTVAERIASIEAQKREVSEARIAPQQYLPQVKIDEAKLKEYYDANPAEFRLPERVRAEYVVLSAEQLARAEPVSDADLKEAYQNRLAQMTESEQRRASHILVKTRDEALQVEAELKKSPARFADLAKKQSQDPGSAEKGGDLGWFGRGMMVKPFEDAAFGMKQGETSGPVQSDFGFHIIRVTGTKAAKARSFEDARAEIEAELKKARAAPALQRGRRHLHQPGLRAGRQPQAGRGALQAAGADHRLDRQVLGAGAGRARQPEAGRRAVLARRHRAASAIPMRSKWRRRRWWRPACWSTSRLRSASSRK